MTYVLSRHMAQLETTSHDELCKLSLVDLKEMCKTHGISCSNKNKPDLIIALIEHKKTLEPKLKKTKVLSSTKLKSGESSDEERKSVAPQAPVEEVDEPVEEYSLLCDESLREAINARAIKLVAGGALDDMIKMMLRNWLSERSPQVVAPPQTDIFTIFEEPKVETAAVVTPPTATKAE